jgi:hypothetical protein
MNMKLQDKIYKLATEYAYPFIREWAMDCWMRILYHEFISEKMMIIVCR